MTIVYYHFWPQMLTKGRPVDPIPIIYAIDLVFTLIILFSERRRS